MEDDRMTVALIAIVVIQLLLRLDDSTREPTQRRPCRKRKRLNWEQHAKELVATNRFQRTYKMSLPAFDALLALLTPALQVDEQQSTNRTGIEAVSPANKLQMFLRYMSGGSVHDIIAYSGVADTTFYDCIDEVRTSLIEHPELQIKFPDDELSLQRIAHGFHGVSNQGVMRGCVGAVDGWLCQTDVPSSKDVGRVRSYFSGHYRCSGVNVQACCDHQSRFLAVAISSTGGTGDSVAYSDCGLSTIVQNFPIGRYIVGDNAYANDNKLLTPFPGPSIGGDIYKDSFNFHLSQLRIRIEMAFGLLVRKWRIFRTPLQVSFRNISRTVMAGCILHNWCINQRLQENPHFNARDDDVLVEALAQLPPRERAQAPDESRYRELYELPQMAALRETEARRRVLVSTEKNMVRSTIVGYLRRNTITRPQRNLVRRARANSSN